MKQTAVIKDTNYIICEDGTLLNILTGKLKNWSKDSNGYMKCTIWINGKSKTISQHRMLAENFIYNPECKLQVNHKNGIKNDNKLYNLEWVTQSENTLHSFANGLQKVTRPCKKVIDVVNGKIYESVSEASKQINISRSALSNMLTNNRKNETNLKN